MSRSIVVAGKGPSLLTINYKRIPKDFDVFRVNDFYIEDKYYLGKKVEYHLVGVSLLEQEYYNVQYLNQKNEYNIQQMIVNNHDKVWENREYQYFFPNVLVAQDLLANEPFIRDFWNFYEFYFGKRMLAGTLAISYAIAKGYTDIYIAGLDFYKTGSTPFKAGEYFVQAISKKWDFKEGEVGELYHDVELDMKYLAALKSQYPNINFYSVSDNTPLNDIFQIAPEINDAPYFPEEKPIDYLRDWLPLPKNIEKQKQKQKLMRQDQEDLKKQNNKSIFSKIKDKVYAYLLRKGVNTMVQRLMNTWLIRAIYELLLIIKLLIQIIIRLLKN